MLWELGELHCFTHEWFTHLSLLHAPQVGARPPLLKPGEVSGVLLQALFLLLLLPSARSPGPLQALPTKNQMWRDS